MTPNAVLLAVDTIVQSVRRQGFAPREVPYVLRVEARTFPPDSPIGVELRARAGRFERALARQEARKQAKENAA